MENTQKKELEITASAYHKRHGKKALWQAVQDYSLTVKNDVFDVYADSNANGARNLVLMLIEQGCCDEENFDAETSIMAAVRLGHHELLDAMFGQIKGLPIVETDGALFGERRFLEENLISACNKGYPHIIALLLGAGFNYPEKNDQTLQRIAGKLKPINERSAEFFYTALSTRGGVLSKNLDALWNMMPVINSIVGILEEYDSRTLPRVSEASKTFIKNLRDILARCDLGKITGEFTVEVERFAEAQTNDKSATLLIMQRHLLALQSQSDSAPNQNDENQLHEVSIVGQENSLPKDQIQNLTRIPRMLEKAREMIKSLGGRRNAFSAAIKENEPDQGEAKSPEGHISADTPDGIALAQILARENARAGNFEALQAAVAAGRTDLVKILDKGSFASSNYVESQSIVLKAIALKGKDKAAQITTLLIEAGFSTNGVDAVIEDVVTLDQQSLVKALATTKGANKWGTPTWHAKALSSAVKNKKLTIVETLLKAGVDPLLALRNIMGQSKVLSSRENKAIVTLLAEASVGLKDVDLTKEKAYPNCRIWVSNMINGAFTRKRSWDRLFEATQKGDFVTVADWLHTNAADERLRTGLHANDSLCLALEKNYPHIVALFLSAGFDPERTDASGRKPTEINPEVLVAAINLNASAEPLTVQAGNNLENKDDTQIQMLNNAVSLLAAITKVRDKFYATGRHEQPSIDFVAKLDVILKCGENCSTNEQILEKVTQAIKEFKNPENNHAKRKTWESVQHHLHRFFSHTDLVPAYKPRSWFEGITIFGSSTPKVASKNDPSSSSSSSNDMTYN